MYSPVMGTGRRPLFCAKLPFSRCSSGVSHFEEEVEVFVEVLDVVVDFDCVVEALFFFAASAAALRLASSAALRLASASARLRACSIS